MVNPLSEYFSRNADKAAINTNANPNLNTIKNEPIGSHTSGDKFKSNDVVNRAENINLLNNTLDLLVGARTFVRGIMDIRDNVTDVGDNFESAVKNIKRGDLERSNRAVKDLISSTTDLFNRFRVDVGTGGFSAEGMNLAVGNEIPNAEGFILESDKASENKNLDSTSIKPTTDIVKAHEHVTDKKDSSVDSTIDGALSLLELIEKLPIESGELTHKIFPFKGRKAHDLGSLDLHDTINWSMKFERYDDTHSSIPPLPFPQYNGWLPIKSYDITREVLRTEKLDLKSGLGIEVILGNSENFNLTTTFMETSKIIIFNWLTEYQNAMVQDTIRVMPYKNACIKITLYVANRLHRTMYKKSFLCYPKVDLSLSGAGTSQIQDRAVNWVVCGQL